MKLDLYLTPLTKINLKWIKDLIVRPGIITLLDENLVKKLLDVNLGNDFMSMTSKAQATKTNLGKCDYIRLKSFCTGKKTTE